MNTEETAGQKTEIEKKNESKDRLNSDFYDKVLDEIAQYFLDLEEDPTQLHLGMKYISKQIAKCRLYTNRVQSYMQKIKRYENRLRADLQVAELDLNLKMSGLLADDVIVRKQPSIEDRKALAATSLVKEYRAVAALKAEISEAEETYKIVKQKHIELKNTQNDIKTQRIIVKDDILAQLGGEGGYARPQSNQDRTIDGGLPPPVTTPIDPSDLLEGTKQTQPAFTPIHESDIGRLKAFLEQSPVATEPKAENPAPEEEKPAETPSEPEEAGPKAGAGFSYTDLIG